MSAMRGRYVLFLDSDDWWDEDLLQSVADVIEQDEPDIVFFGYRDEWFSMDDRQLQTVHKIPKAISIKITIWKSLGCLLFYRLRTMICIPGQQIKQ